MGRIYVNDEGRFSMKNYEVDYEILGHDLQMMEVERSPLGRFGGRLSGN